tara:strand:- start:30 stop:446 length:417 start_codon:yes stop_codon:yes gene_type:complete
MIHLLLHHSLFKDKKIMSEETFNKTQAPGNPYKGYLVTQDIELNIKIPEGNTEIKINTEQEMPTYGKDFSDAQQIHALSNHHGKNFYKRQIIKDIKDWLWNMETDDIDITLSDTPTIKLMNDEMYDEFEKDQERRDRL